MSSISSLLLKNKTLPDSRLIKVFKSKKNTVCLIEKNKSFFVLKWFQQGEEKHFWKEYHILSKTTTPFLKPHLIKKDKEDKFLILQHIPGNNICDVINDSQIDTNGKIIIITQLAKWFYQFHTYFQSLNKSLIHGDAHLRNFILTKNHAIYGVDFEEAYKGEPIKDISDLCASILMTNPEFTEEKINLVHHFIQTYVNLNCYTLQDINSNIQNSINTMIKRRRK